MHDVKAIRDDPDAFVRGWTLRNLPDAAGVVGDVLRLDAELRAIQTSLQDSQARRNEASKLIGQAKGRKDEDEAQRLMVEVEMLKALIAERFEAEGRVGMALKELLAGLPNIPVAEVPAGADEHDNVEVESHRFGDAKALPAGRLNAPKDHVELGEALGLMDFEAATRMSGSRFVALKGPLAQLERALGQFMLDLQTTEHGYTEVSPPLLVRDEAMFGTGQLPKFYDDQFSAMRMSERERLLRKAITALDLELANRQSRTSHSAVDLVFELLARADTEEDLWLIPTAEVSLTNLVREQILVEEELPLRYTALTACFRSEAGASGKDTRGMIRQHQFYKVELVSIVAPEQSEAEHERMVGCAETVLKRLELPFRTMLLCAGDMGFTARKTFDLEVWLPSQNRYREISSCSNCGDFQARRMDARTRKSGAKGARFVHTLNGSGLAVGRTLVAILENYQDEAGRIAIPSVLQPYMRGLTHIG